MLIGIGMAINHRKMLFTFLLRQSLGGLMTEANEAATIPVPEAERA
jgi:hypothetical protein